MTHEEKKGSRRKLELLRSHPANYLLLVAVILLVADALFTILEYNTIFEITNMVLIFMIGGSIWLFMHLFKETSRETR